MIVSWINSHNKKRHRLAFWHGLLRAKYNHTTTENCSQVKVFIKFVIYVLKSTNKWTTQDPIGLGPKLKVNINPKYVLVSQPLIHKLNQHFWVGYMCYVKTCSFPTLHFPHLIVHASNISTLNISPFCHIVEFY